VGSFLHQLRAFGTAGLCTIALFAIAAWIPNDVIDFVAWLIAVVLGLPVSILTRVQAVRTTAPTARLVLAAHTLPRVLGAVSVFLGAGILGWQVYSFIVRRPRELNGVTAIAQALLVVMLIVLGYRLLRRSARAERTDNDAA
jgi:hypothetical protein